VIKLSGASREGKASRRAAAVKKRRGWRVAFVSLAGIGVVAAAAWVLFASSLLAVRSVVVSGTRLVPRSEVLAAAGIKPGTPLIRVNLAQIETRVDTIRQVRSAQVTRSWPNGLVIVVRERTPALALPAFGGVGYDLVDAGGVVVQRVARRPADVPLYPTVAPEGALRGDPGLAAAAAVLGELPAQLRRSVISVTAPNPGQVTLRLHGGVTVLWGDTSRAAVKARELAVLMRAHLRYYDVSAPGSVTAK
jgi:cell division protein FtsQ